MQFLLFVTASKCRNETLSEPFFFFPDAMNGNSTIRFTPYLENIPDLGSLYPPADLGLSSVVEVDISFMVQMSNEHFICALCDSPLLDNNCGTENLGINSATNVLVQYRK